MKITNRGVEAWTRGSTGPMRAFRVLIRATMRALRQERYEDAERILGHAMALWRQENGGTTQRSEAAE